MDFTNIKFGNAHNNKNNRSAYRTQIPGLKVVVTEHGVYEVKDLSATGVAFCPSETEFIVGAQIEVALTYGGRILADKLPAQIVRSGKAECTACLFQDLSLRQEAMLDKLVLEVQKRLISLRKAKESKLTG